MMIIDDVIDCSAWAVAAHSIFMPVISGCSRRVRSVFGLVLVICRVDMDAEVVPAERLGAGYYVMWTWFVSILLYVFFLAEPRLMGMWFDPLVLINEGMTDHEYRERGETIHMGPWRREA